MIGDVVNVALIIANNDPKVFVFPLSPRSLQPKCFEQPTVFRPVPIVPRRMQVISRSNVLTEDLYRGEIYGKDRINSSLVGIIIVLYIGGFKRGRRPFGYSRTNHGNSPGSERS